MPEEEPVVVALRRKVRSLETNLLEWRRCACTFTRDARLELELSDDDVDDVELDDADASDGGSDAASRRLRGTCRVVIDLASQLRRIEQKRKNKTRCEIEYHYHHVVGSGGGRQSSRHGVRTEELMASSAKHCQQFVDQVRAAEQHGKRAESIRLGSLLAANVAASGTVLPALAVAQSASSVSQSSSDVTTNVAVGRRSGGSQLSPPKVKIDDRRRVHTSLASTSEKSDEISAPAVCIVDASDMSMPSRHGDTEATMCVAAAGVSPGAAMRPSADSGLAGSMVSSTASHRRSGADVTCRAQHRAVAPREYEVRCRCCD